IPDNHPFDFSKDLFPLMLRRGDPLYGYISEGYWCDVGNMTEYVRACSDLLAGKVQVGEMGKHIGGGIWTGEGVEIAPDAQLYGPIYLGTEVKVKGGVVIHGPTAIRDYTIVDNRAHIDRSFVWRNCYIGEAVELRGAVVAKQTTFKAKSVAFEGVVVGDNCVIGEGAILHAGIKLWPGKEIESGATVRSSIIWGSQGRRVLFGRFGVTGVVNVDLTPEFCARLGAAFGATLPKGSVVTLNRDPHDSPRMLKRAIISGLPSAGVHVQDLRSQPIPVARYYTRVSGAAGGVHVRLSPYDQRVVDIRFMDKNGLNLSKDAERSIERVYFREDFRRAYLNDVGTIDYAPQVEERYTEGFLAAVDAEMIRSAGFKVVVDYAHAPSSQVLAPILEQLGVDVVPLNARIHKDKMSVLPEEFSASLRQMATIVQALGKDLGVQLDVGGEKIFIADERGAVLTDRVAAAAMVSLALQAQGGGTVVVPVDQSQVFETLAARYKGKIARCKVDIASVMQASGRRGVLMALDGTGNYIFPAFQTAPDGLMAVAKLLQYLAHCGQSLSKVVAELPPIHISHGRVSCPWEEKGKVMRLLNEQYKNYRADNTDGIKVFISDSDWVLVLPDPDKPMFHVTAESTSPTSARELVDKYSRIVEGLQR
ncbi:MAG: mannose-1-phosphate guanyltransferase, partial [Anaerolineae bacterium]|nr:mannose-1-phosphate guanyltransferase [Anaerolineae bacterium]